MKGKKSREAFVQRVHRLLADPRRHHLLVLLAENGGCNLDRLVRGIATRDRSESSGSVTEAEREQIAISLVHNHLPRLADHDLVEFDQRSGDVALTDRFATLEPLIQQLERDVDGVRTSFEGSTLEGGFQATAGR